MFTVGRGRDYNRLVTPVPGVVIIVEGGIPLEVYRIHFQ